MSRNRRNNLYEDDFDQGIAWNNSQCTFMVILLIVAGCALAASIIAVVKIYDVDHHVHELAASIGGGSKRSTIPELDASHLIESPSPSLDARNVPENDGDLDALDDMHASLLEFADMQNAIARDARTQTQTRLTPNCIAHWSVVDCGLAVWQMCNNGPVCSTSQVCKEYAKRIIKEVQRLPGSYSEADTPDMRQQIGAASQACIRDAADPACGFVIQYVCKKPAIFPFCQQLVQILQAKHIEGVL